MGQLSSDFVYAALTFSFFGTTAVKLELPALLLARLRSFTLVSQVRHSTPSVLVHVNLQRVLQPQLLFPCSRQGLRVADGPVFHAFPLTSN